MNVYAEMQGLCPRCAKDAPGFYEERGEGMFLKGECGEHGPFREKVENDCPAFKKAYEDEYPAVLNHLVLPVTYRCNLRCTYCYTLSNSSLPLPPDRTLERLAGICSRFSGDITFIGGEPTVRDDLPELIKVVKRTGPGKKVSLSTNGQRIADFQYLERLKESGLDFVLLSYNDIRYDKSEVIHQNKLAAFDNCLRLNMPVWAQQTIDDLPQLDSMVDVIEKYQKIVFHVSLRSAKPFGINHPTRQIFVSDILKYFKKEKDFTKGTNPFNRHIRLKGKNVKICSWINDPGRLDPIDYKYFISSDELLPFHRGMKTDEVQLLRNNYPDGDSAC